METGKRQRSEGLCLQGASKSYRGRTGEEGISGPIAGLDHWRRLKQLWPDMQLQERTKLIHMSLYALDLKRHLACSTQRKDKLDLLAALTESSISGGLWKIMQQKPGGKGSGKMSPKICHQREAIWAPCLALVIAFSIWKLLLLGCF